MIETIQITLSSELASHLGDGIYWANVLCHILSCESKNIISSRMLTLHYIDITYYAPKWFFGGIYIHSGEPPLSYANKCPAPWVDFTNAWSDCTVELPSNSPIISPLIGYLDMMEQNFNLANGNELDSVTL